MHSKQQDYSNRIILTKQSSPYIPTPFVNSDLWHTQLMQGIRFIASSIKLSFSASIFLTCHAITPTQIPPASSYKANKNIDMINTARYVHFILYGYVLIRKSMI